MGAMCEGTLQALWGWVVWLVKRRLGWECGYVGGGKPSGASADPRLWVTSYPCGLFVR